ncbi:FG-GAP repeat domain-containing protein [Yoonia vestfoldensis]|uniref:Repeat domain in Vibrio, Colwellia, Bradyrhizobium and Shewanella n=1 Tax=Yoonia vestfoldensis TaxID=245188 RepID=A0A1Y0EH64_9RHOB|nr:VCBS repeat-containing protein [Yoonia vestfoldensis]ARU02788.1 repeat domain in Vibrio, Colwellia, Bradyrhizobium and Shewanella [Yoonia vestfoldensis]
MTNDLKSNTLLCTAPKYTTDFVDEVKWQKVVRQSHSVTASNQSSISLSTTRTAMLLTPLALAACGGGDGNNNIEASSSSNLVARFENFQPQSSASTSPNFFTVYASDINADGRSDFIISGGSFPPAVSDSFSIVTIKSSGSIYEITNTDFETKFIHPAEILTADFNADGLLDIFVATSGYDTSPFIGERNGIFLQSANGSFIDSSTNLPNVADNTHSATVGDINGDGFVDIYVGNIFNSGAILPYLLLNSGDGSFVKLSLSPEIFDYTTGFAGGNSKKYTSSLFADVDNDSDIELILGMDANSSSMILEFNATNNTFSVSKLLPSGYFGADTITLDIKAGDINNDGRVDLVLSQTTNNPFYEGRALQILLQQENGDFVDISANSNFTINKPWIQTISLIDIDKDGDLDIVGAANAGGIYVFHNDGSGVFSEANAGNAAFSDARANVKGAISDDLGTVFEVIVDQPTLEVYQYV